MTDQKKEIFDGAYEALVDAHQRVSRFMAEVGNLLAPPLGKPVAAEPCDPPAEPVVDTPVDTRGVVSIDLHDRGQMERLLDAFNAAEYEAHGNKVVDCRSGSCWIRNVGTALLAVQTPAES